MNALSSGNWLTRERIAVIAALSGLASLLSLAWLFGWSNGTLDPLGRPLGTDFSQLWTAGQMALDGRAADVWSWPEHFAAQQQLHQSMNVELYGWHYPPPFLLVAAALASLPYIPALIVWQAATLAGFAGLMWRLVPRRETMLLVLAAPVTLICLTHGHNGFLTALLLGGALMLLERRPLAAGLLLGCLIYKPQFALVIPPLLLTTRNWRAIGGALLSSSALVVLTLAIWGWPVWQAFLDSLPLTREIVIEQGKTGWHKIVSAFSAVRMWGGGVALAYAVQLAVTGLAMVAVVWASLRLPSERRNALVCAAALAATPYVLDYDLVVLLPALAWIWIDRRRAGWLAWDKWLMAFAWAAPLAGRQVAQTAYVPLDLLSVLAVAWLALRASPSRR